MTGNASTNLLSRPLITAGPCGKLALPVLALLARFSKARREDHSRARARVRRLAHRIDHIFRRDRHHDHVDRLRHVADRPIGGEALNGVLARIDRIDRPLESAFQHIVDRSGAEFAKRIGRANHRDAFRVEERGEIGPLRRSQNDILQKSARARAQQ